MRRIGRRWHEPRDRRLSCALATVAVARAKRTARQRRTRSGHGGRGGRVSLRTCQTIGVTRLSQIRTPPRCHCHRVEGRLSIRAVATSVHFPFPVEVLRAHDHCPVRLPSVPLRPSPACRARNAPRIRATPWSCRPPGSRRISAIRTSCSCTSATRPSMTTTHIAGARFVALDDISVSDHSGNGLMLEMPPAERAAPAARRARHLRRLADRRLLRQGLGDAGHARDLHARLRRARRPHVAARRRHGRVDARRTRGDDADDAGREPASSSPLHLKPIVVDAGLRARAPRRAGRRRSSTGAPRRSTTACRRAAVTARRTRPGHIAGAKSVPFTEIADDAESLEDRRPSSRRCSRRPALQPGDTDHRLLPHRTAGDRACCSPRARSGIRSCSTTARSRTGRSAIFRSRHRQPSLVRERTRQPATFADS